MVLVSPKSAAFPVVAIVMESIILHAAGPGFSPPTNKPLKCEHICELSGPLASVKSPKSVASPVDAIVTKSMTADFDPESCPPPNIPRVVLETPPL